MNIRGSVGQAWKVYANRQMMTLLALGFSSGLPRLLVYSTLTFWLLEVGASITTVGLFALTSLPYTIKFLWAPLIDRAPIPLLTARLGQRRGWLLLTQLGVALTLALLAAMNPAASLTGCAVAALLVAFASASQDIVIDAFRVESLAQDEQGAGAAVAVFGYRLGMLVAGAGALGAATFLESWPLVYLLMAGCMIVGLVATILGREPAPQETGERPPKGVAQHLKRAVWGPLSDLLGRRGVVAFLAFIMLYKIGDALAGTMLNPLLVDIGFTKLEIAAVAKTHGLVASIFGVFLGGWLVKRVGVMRALWIAGFMQMFSNLVFVFQALLGHDVFLLTITIGVENMCGGVGTAAFVAYLSGLCRDRYTATQYALLTAISSMLKLTLSGTTGFLVALLGWPLFFGFSTLCAIPGLVMIYLLQRFGATGLEPEPEDRGEDASVAAVFE